MCDSPWFQTVLGLQLLYVALGAGYNLLSLANRAHGKPALAPTNPRTGLFFMTILLYSHRHVCRQHPGPL